jgi:hypothetical protein
VAETQIIGNLEFAVSWQIDETTAGNGQNLAIKKTDQIRSLAAN